MKTHRILGILGAGQLARMLTLSAHSLGIQTLCLDPNATPCTSQIGATVQADYQDEEALRAFANRVDVITIENENIPEKTAALLTQLRPFYPSLDALVTSQDRLSEKQFFKALGIPTAAFFEVNTLEDLHKAGHALGFPAILKTRCFGYDGKGQAILKKPRDAELYFEILGTEPLILEQMVPFDKELSLISVRSIAGEIRHYPLIENHHQRGILRLSEAPYHHTVLQALAEEYAQNIMTALNYVGVLTIEFFLLGEKLIANEIAPRVHNSGHWTIEGADTSQFENHLRAVCDLPLGSTFAKGVSAMVNAIGHEPQLNQVLAIAGTHYHSYGKSARADRKLGHATLNVSNESLRNTQLPQLLQAMTVKPNPDE